MQGIPESRALLRRAGAVVVPERPVWRDGNQITLLHNGTQYFPALCQAIATARHSVHLETYIFHLDRTGQALLEHLVQARQRGVRVRLVIDGFGSRAHARAIVQRCQHAGIQCRVYRPEPAGLRNYRVDPRRLRRLHRKVVVVDRRIAFVGGINVLDDFEAVPDDGAGPRFDFAVCIQGPLVFDVVRAQRRLWLRMAWRELPRTRKDWTSVSQRLMRWTRTRDAQWLQTWPQDPQGCRAILLLRDNLRFRRTIESAYLRALQRAHHEVLIANAYFLPGRRLRQTLKRTATRGVRVRLLLQGRSEYPMQHRATRHLYRNLLAHGVELYEYMASYLHAKVAVIDHTATIGSSNLDPFSLLLAREANVFIDDATFAARLRQLLEHEMQRNARRIQLQDLQRRGWWGRTLDAISYVLLRIGVALTGRASR